ncbi:MAG: methyltransferase domain-containing protein [Candidatus Nealsonbacteria bacterium]|nr:methyltransferase domain-containing protein [Candidatus Nealsonbacteria bacterium]
MRNPFADCGLFFKEFFTNFHTTGAVMPSGRFLAAALARFVREGTDPDRKIPDRKILEVGPGTGAVTRWIIPAMRDGDQLDLVELNDSFVARLRDRFEHDPLFQTVAPRSRVLHCGLEELADGQRYDLIVSGLPLNNFSAEVVEQLLAVMVGLLQPGGTLSFFEYIGMRRLRSLVSRRAERLRLQGIARAMDTVLDNQEIARDRIWPNVPPAWVHHVRV